jgi:hypothetical protein
MTIAMKVGKETMKDIVMFMKNKLDQDSVLSWLEIWLEKNSTGGFSHNIDDNKVHTCIMKHDLGEKWSLYHLTVLESVFREILQKPLFNVTSSHALLAFSFRE